MERKIDISEWQGFAEIWREETYHVGMWPGAFLRIDANAIEVQVPKDKVEITPEKVLEIRMFRLPLPSLTIISLIDGKNTLISFSAFRHRLIEAALKRNGFPAINYHTWRTGFEAGRDQKTYQLQKNSDSRRIKAQ